MDDILTEFISQTRADPALAHDLLEAANWNLGDALAVYDGLMDTRAVVPEQQLGPDPYLIQDTVPMDHNGADKTDGDGNSTDMLEDSFEARKKLLRQTRDGRAARGLSFLAEDVVDKFHKVAVSKYRVSSQEQTVIDEQFFRHSFVYPDFSSQSQELQEFIASDLIDVSVKTSLEKNNRLNWWAHTGKFPQLEPLATSGDGNCLLHAASLYMWGFHDRFLILRSSMYRLLTQSREKEGILSRWRYQTQLRNNEAGGLTFSEEEWEFEWSEVVRIATNKPRNELTADSIRRQSTLRFSYEYLEEIHIFALAHVTQRPIVVISDTTLKGTSGEDLAPIYFGGIYLPLEMNPTACHKPPVVLAYDAAHFSALVAKEEKSQQPAPSTRQARGLRGRVAAGKKREEPFIPLVGPDGCLLPIQFVYDPARPAVDEKWGKMQYKPGEFPPELIRLLENYLNIRWVELPIFTRCPSPDPSPASQTDQDYDHLPPSQEQTKLRCPAALLAQESQPVYQKELIDKYMENVHERFEEEKQRQRKVAQHRAKMEEEIRLRKPVPCKGEGCDMYGTASTNNLCSVCYQKSVGQDDEVEKVDFASERELDSETVELYMPSIGNDPPPSYTEAVTSFSVGNDHGEEEMAEGEEGEEGEGENQANGHDSSEPAVIRKVPPIPPPKPGQGSQLSESGNGSLSGEGSVEKSPKRQKGWVKKLQVFPSGLLPGSKSKKTSGGYSRDNIQPISFEMSQTNSTQAQTVSGKTKCVNAGCKFFGSSDSDGYCSSCYKEMQTSKGPATVV